jgi:plastocyanin
MRLARYLPVILVAAVLAAVGARAAFSSHTAVSQTMHAFVHDDASIGLAFDDGSPVGTQARTPPTIPPGTYTIKVVDDAQEHNFHLTGPGVEESTDIGGYATTTWTVTFQPGGTYRFLCDAHPDFMFGVFTVSGSAAGGTSSGGTSSGGTSSGGTSSSGGTTSGGTTSSGTASGGTSSGGAHSTLAGTLVGRVDAAGKLRLTYGGIPVKRVKAGRYRITVADRTAKRGFLVRRAGHAATTVSGVAFVGTHSVTLQLAAGKWTFFSSAGPKSSATFTVTP